MVRWLAFVAENFAVPELTRILNIKLNMQVSLWPACAAISSRTGYPQTQHFKAVGRSSPPGGFDF